MEKTVRMIACKSDLGPGLAQPNLHFRIAIDGDPARLTIPDGIIPVQKAFLNALILFNFLDYIQRGYGINIETTPSPYLGASRQTYENRNCVRTSTILEIIPAL